MDSKEMSLKLLGRVGPTRHEPKVPDTTHSC